MDNYETIESKLANRERFTGNSLRGYWDGFSGNYVVYSYGTMVANYNPTTLEYWVNPNKYSQTTTRQQNIIKRAWGLN
jgi:hypothetical protein